MMLTAADKLHWGNRVYRNPDGSVFQAPAMIHGVSIAGVTVLKKGEFHNRFAPNRIAGVTESLEVAPLKKEIKDPAAKIGRPTKEKAKRDIDYRVNGREVKTRIRLFLDAMRKPRLYMITISFPPMVDRLIVKYRNAWETGMRKKNWLVHFLWVAERQTETNTLHFHFAVFNRIDIKKANITMRNLLRKGVRDRELTYPKEYVDKYNGVDLAKHRTTKKPFDFARNRKALSNYLTKYITKGEGEENNFPGRAWGCSQSLSNLCKRFSLTEKEYQEFLQLYGGELEKIEIEDPQVAERLDFYRWTKGPPAYVTKVLSLVNVCIIDIIEQARGKPRDLFSNN